MKLKDIKKYNILNKNWNYTNTGSVANTYYNILDEKIDSSGVLVIDILTGVAVTTVNTALTFKIYNADTSEIYHILNVNTYNGVISLPKSIVLTGHIKVDVKIQGTYAIFASISGSIIS